MVRKGLLAECERCGFTNFFMGETVREAEQMYLDSDWAMHEGKCLCPNCTLDYEEMFEEFMKNEVK